MDLEAIAARIAVDDHGCFVWKGGKTSAGYGHVHVPGGKTNYVHRIMYERVFGPIPPGHEIDHLRRNRACANPDHLEAVTRRENTARGANKSARAMRENRCYRGHEFTPENTYTVGNRRKCRQCGRENTRAYDQRQRTERGY